MSRQHFEKLEELKTDKKRLDSMVEAKDAEIVKLSTQIDVNKREACEKESKLKKQFAKEI